MGHVPAVVRLAAAQDSAAVAAVVRGIYANLGFAWEEDGAQADLYDIGAYYLDRGDRLWVAELGRAVVGVIGLRRFAPLPGEIGQTVVVDNRVRLAGCDAALARLYVAASARRRGIGTALLTTAVGEARQRGRQAVELWSDKRFGAAHRLYQRLGARPVAERSILDPDPCEEWGLVIDLRADPASSVGQ